MNRKLFILVIIVLIIFNILLIIKYNNDCSSINQIKNDISSNKNIADIYDHFNNIIKIDKNLMITNLDRENVPFNSILNGKPKLILKYSEKNCWSCVAKIIRRLIRYSKKHNINLKNHMLILASYRIQNNFVIFHKNRDIEIPVYNIKNESLGFNDDRLQKEPIFFVTDSTYLSKMVYIPIINESELMNKYFNKVFKYILPEE